MSGVAWLTGSPRLIDATLAIILARMDFNFPVAHVTEIP